MLHVTCADKEKMKPAIFRIKFCRLTIILPGKRPAALSLGTRHLVMFFATLKELNLFILPKPVGCSLIDAYCVYLCLELRYSIFCVGPYLSTAENWQFWRVDLLSLRRI